MHADVLPYLRCPVCRAPFAADGDGTARTLRCPTGHSFDVARQGHVDLVTGRTGYAGDSPEMVAARADFLRRGHFAVVAAGLAQAAREHLPPTRPFVVDAGAGTGTYLSAVLDALPDAVGLALDISKAAVRRAARAHPAAAAVRCDTWRPLPVAADSAGLILNVFAPRNGAEFARILHPRGVLLVVAPLPEHLGELVGALRLLTVDPAKQDRIGATLGGHFAEVSRRTLRQRLRLGHDDVAASVRMGPSSWHADPQALATSIAALPEPVTVTVAVQLTVYRPR
ncbi:putative RNA methyltransferase [Micromonospora sp. LOL_023]|uniref:putative RNA methyltransferase n=1 Tax=Micromonospora sp. LOL_023 TaxID=3345418 RepID=UPI003A838E85